MNHIATDSWCNTKPPLKEVAIRLIRKEYYAVSDGLFGLSEISAILCEDETLRKDIYMLMKKLNDVEKHLTNNYKWD